MQYVRKFEKTGTQLKMRLYFDCRYVAYFSATFDDEQHVFNVNCEVVNELYCNAMTIMTAMQHFTQALYRCLGDDDSASKLFPTEADLLL